MAGLKEVAENLIQGKAPQVKELVQKAVDKGQDVTKILNEGLLAAMSVVGDKFKKNEFYVPEVLIAARAMKAGMKVIRSLLTDKGVKAVSNLKRKVKVMIGGAPVTQSYADEIEADGYAPDAASAVDKAKELLVA